MLNKKDYFCEDCGGDEYLVVGSPDNPEIPIQIPCERCDMSGYSDSKILTLIHSESLESVLAGIEVIRAMKEKPEENIYIGNSSGQYLNYSGKEFILNKNFSAKWKSFDSPLTAIRALLGEGKG